MDSDEKLNEEKKSDENNLIEEKKENEDKNINDKKENDINQINENEIKKENDINEEKRNETETYNVNYINTKSDFNFNLTTSFEEFENKIQELKEKINQSKTGNLKITNNTIKSYSATGNLNINRLNDNSNARNKLKELFTMIGGPGKNNGKIGLMNNKPPIKFNNTINPSINDYKNKSQTLYSNKKYNISRSNNNNNVYNNLSFKNSPLKKSNDFNNDNFSKSFGFSTISSEKKSTNKKNYYDFFKPITLNAIRNSSLNNNKNEIKKRNNQFDKQYFKGELENFKNLLFGTTSKKFKTSTKDEVIDPFFNPKSLKSTQKKKISSINGGDNFFSSKYTGVNTNKPKINLIV
jgi:hypothetical protein